MIKSREELIRIAQESWSIERDSQEAIDIYQSVKLMTLEEAKQMLSEPGVPCACYGGPYCCITRYAVAKQLVERAEHE